MASISVPCPKCRAAVARPRRSLAPPRVVSSPFPGSWSLRLAKESNGRQSPVRKVQIQEASSSVNSSANSKPETHPDESVGSDEPDKSLKQAPVSESTISAFMSEASRIVKLVDSKDVSELKLKYNGCELVIRKKEALEQPASSAPPLTMQYPPSVFPAQFPVSQAFPPAAPSPAPPAPAAPAAPAAPPAAPQALPPPTKGGSKSSLPPLKSPMAGNFYRSPAPGAPQFVQVGDKVKKGQVVCIIEAMKLMNEIEADQDGTVVEILMEDGKSVSFNAPLLIIKP